MATKIRSSKQILVDDHLDLNSKRINNVADPVLGNDAANKSYVDTKTSGLASALHAPVANLAAAKAIISSDRSDKMMLNIEDMGLYRYDSESTATSDDNLIIRPTDIPSDASAGRWMKMSSQLDNHNNLSNVQGGATNEYYHLTSAERTAATRNANASQNGLLSPTDYNTFVAKLGIGNFVNREVPTGTKNGSNIYFTLANTPLSGTEMIYVDGLLQEGGIGKDYTLTTNTITFATAPLASCVILASYWKA